jgi:hypothetical protein
MKKRVNLKKRFWRQIKKLLTPVVREVIAERENEIIETTRRAVLH